MSLLNIGCGTRFHPGWVNVDLEPAAPGVLALDLRAGLPFAPQSFQAVYCSHVLEHLDRRQAAALLAQAREVLRPGGIVRIAVPDLEAMARLYLDLLADPSGREADYDWIMLEMYDQAVRTVPGGEMGRWLADPGLPNAAFVASRIGPQGGAAPCAPPGRLRRAIRHARMSAVALAARLLGGRTAAEAFAEGRFRQSGEVHRWMYDAFSLARALRAAGFADPRRRTASESAIADFARYGLDVDEAGRVRKPDSLFMEATRP